MPRPEHSDLCYICERQVGTRGEWDHFPTPQRQGGTNVLPVCLPCHDMKDRVLLENWNAETAVRGMLGLWTKATADERLCLVKMVHIVTTQ